MFFCFSLGALNHYYTFSVTANIKYFKDSFSDFPYDMNFSVAFDIITFFLKIFICLDKNIEMFYGIEAKKKFNPFWCVWNNSLFFIFHIFINSVIEKRKLHFVFSFDNLCEI